jgi:hypothetical protein
MIDRIEEDIAPAQAAAVYAPTAPSHPPSRMPVQRSGEADASSSGRFGDAARGAIEPEAVGRHHDGGEPTAAHPEFDSFPATALFMAAIKVGRSRGF